MYIHFGNTWQLTYCNAKLSVIVIKSNILIHLSSATSKESKYDLMLSNVCHFQYHRHLIALWSRPLGKFFNFLGLLHLEMGKHLGFDIVVVKWLKKWPKNPKIGRNGIVWVKARAIPQKHYPMLFSNVPLHRHVRTSWNMTLWGFTACLSMTQILRISSGIARVVFTKENFC